MFSSRVKWFLSLCRKFEELIYFIGTYGALPSNLEDTITFD